MMDKAYFLDERHVNVESLGVEGRRDLAFGRRVFFASAVDAYFDWCRSA